MSVAVSGMSRDLVRAECVQLRDCDQNVHQHRWQVRQSARRRSEAICNIDISWLHARKAMPTRMTQLFPFQHQYKWMCLGKILVSSGAPPPFAIFAELCTPQHNISVVGSPWERWRSYFCPALLCRVSLSWHRSRTPSHRR